MAMSNTKWTNGDWRKSETQKGRPKVVDHNGFTIATAGAQPYNHADFQVMAASKDMYAALQLARETIAAFPKSMGYDLTHLEPIDSALAKARGEV